MKKETNFNCTEEFITATPKLSEKELRDIFNKKLFAYIKRLENRNLEN